MRVLKEARKFSCTNIAGFVSHPCGAVTQMMVLYCGCCLR